MVADRAAVAEAEATGATAHDRSPRGRERDPVPGLERLRLGAAAEGISPVHDGPALLLRLAIAACCAASTDT